MRSCVCVCSLIRQLADAPAAVPAVAAALSNTAPAFSLGLPGLTKLICDCSKRGEHAKALAVFYAAPTLSLVPDRPLCNAAIHAAGRGGNGEAAAAIVLHMLTTQIEPDAVTYRSAMETLSKHCSLELAVWVRRPFPAPLHPVRAETQPCSLLRDGLAMVSFMACWSLRLLNNCERIANI